MAAATLLALARPGWSQEVADSFALPIANYVNGVTQAFGAHNPNHLDPAGKPKRHVGEDVSGIGGTTVVTAAASGKVMLARTRGTCDSNWGHILVIEHT